jgi:hypothetical protein
MATRQESAVLKNMAQGQFTKTATQGAATAWAAGSELAPSVWGSANNKVIEVYLTMRWSMVAQTEDEGHVPYEWAFVRNTSSSAPNLSDSLVLENLMRDKKILARGFGFAAPPSAKPEVHIQRFFNVALEEDEYLVFVITPTQSTIGATIVGTYYSGKRELALD